MKNSTPNIQWDFGTAYDLFASLHVLHHPDRFGLRGSWAAGVRSRLTVSQRSILEDAQELFISGPFVWVSHLAEPKDAATALRTLDQITPTERLPALISQFNKSAEVMVILRSVTARGEWDEGDLARLQAGYQQRGRPSRRENILKVLTWWSHLEEFGERYLGALEAYVDVFFAEEERRIQPYLQQALEHAQQMANQLDFAGLMVELSQGVKITALEEAEQVVFAPSYWTTPLVVYDQAAEKEWVVLFGARPAEVALVPGEVVPDAMLRALNALSDSTRLLILRYLSDQPQTPSQLAKKLRLRAPTVVHHLNILRLAGLVYISLEAGEEKRYTVRETVVRETFATLQKFLALRGEG